MTASARVQEEWRRRVEAEYRSAAFTQHLTLWLTQLAASPDLIREGLRMAEDELVHSELSYDVYGAAGGVEPPTIDLNRLSLPRRGEALDVNLVCVATEMFCLGETIAVALFSHFRQMASQPAARRALDRILRDEVRHRDYGWTLIEWLLESDVHGHRRRAVELELPAMFARIERSFGEVGAPLSPNEPLSEQEREWGLAPASDYTAILRRTVERDYLPRFGLLGLGAAAAWRARG
jgi:hypothetical protein